MASGNASTLASANAHSDAGDAMTLTASKSYTDTRAASTLTAANAYTDSRLNSLGSDFDQFRGDIADDRQRGQRRLEERTHRGWLRGHGRSQFNGHRVDALLDSAAEATLVDPVFAKTLKLGRGKSETGQGSGEKAFDAKLIDGVTLKAVGVTILCVTSASPATSRSMRCGWKWCRRRVDVSAHHHGASLVCGRSCAWCSLAIARR